jgi:hypothetical protein
MKNNLVIWKIYGIKAITADRFNFWKFNYSKLINEEHVNISTLKILSWQNFNSIIQVKKELAAHICSFRNFKCL